MSKSNEGATKPKIDVEGIVAKCTKDDGSYYPHEDILVFSFKDYGRVTENVGRADKSAV